MATFPLHVDLPEDASVGFIVRTALGAAEEVHLSLAQVQAALQKLVELAELKDDDQAIVGAVPPEDILAKVEEVAALLVGEWRLKFISWERHERRNSRALANRVKLMGAEPTEPAEGAGGPP